MTQIARDKVKGPALGLKITAGVGAVTSILSIVGSVFNVGIAATEGGDEGLAGMMGGTLGLVAAVIGVGVAVFLWIAGGKMANLVSYNLCLAASIVAMVPCVSPCCVIGLPIGIWAVIVLAKPEVKSAFTG